MENADREGIPKKLIPKTTRAKHALHQTTSPESGEIKDKVKTTKIKNLNIFYFNSRSIANKVNDLAILLKQDKHDIIMISETWLKKEHLSSSILNSTEYTMFRCDRTRCIGGGTAIICKTHLSSRINQLEIQEQDEFEIVAVDYYYNCKSCYRFVCVYFSPTNALNSVSTSTLTRTLNKLIPRDGANSPLFLLGDFNLSGVDWVNSNSKNNHSSFQVFNDFLNRHNLNQIITTPTHKLGSTLDLVITSHPLKVLDFQIGEPFTKTCDHYSIDLKINIKYSISVNKPTYYNFYKSDFQGITNFLSLQDWDDILDSKQGIDTMYKRFTTVVHQAFTIYVPKIKKTTRPKFPKNIRELLKRKKIIYRRMKLNPSLKNEYKNIDKLYKRSVKTFFKSYEERVMKSSNKNMFHSYVKKKLKSPNYLPPLLKPDGSLILDPLDKANTLNSFFASIFTVSNPSTLPSLPQWTTNFTNMPPFIITDEDINNAIHGLKSSVSRTPDDIPCLFF